VTRKRLFLFGALVVPFTFAASCASTSPPGAPAPIFKKEKISTGDEPHLPSAYLTSGCGSSVNGSYKLCISPQGKINSVDVVQGIPDADADIMATLWRWRYKPQVIPVCFVQNLQFQIDCHKSRNAQDPESKAGADGEKGARGDAMLDSWKGETIPAAYLDGQKIQESDNPAPPAPSFVQNMRCGSGVSGSYRICVGQTGEVSAVDIVMAASADDAPIVDALKRWRFRPQPAPVCVVKQFDFSAPCK